MALDALKAILDAYHAGRLVADCEGSEGYISSVIDAGEAALARGIGAGTAETEWLGAKPAEPGAEGTRPEQQAQSAAPVQLEPVADLRAVYEAARGLLRFNGVDRDRTMRYADELDAAIERVKAADGDCEKAPHNPVFGYLHGENDDSPYDVDGVSYCGRCHRFIGGKE